MAKYEYKYTEDKQGIAVNSQGYPIMIVTEDGKDPEEIGVNAIETYQRVPELRSEAKQHRLEAKKLKDSLELFTKDGLELDKIPEWYKTAVAAMATVKNLNDGDLVKAGEVETIKQQATSELEVQVDELTRQREEMESSKNLIIEEQENEIHNLMIGDNFATSKYVLDSLNMTPRTARAHFSGNFKVEKNDDGKRIIVGRFNDGSKILDPAQNFGLADFETCVERLVQKDPDRDSLLLGVGGGSGASGPGKGGSSTGVNPWKSETFNLTEQGEILTSNPEAAQRMKAEAGVLS